MYKSILFRGFTAASNLCIALVFLRLGLQSDLTVFLQSLSVAAITISVVQRWGTFEFARKFSTSPSVLSVENTRILMCGPILIAGIFWIMPHSGQESFFATSSGALQVIYTLTILMLMGAAKFQLAVHKTPDWFTFTGTFLPGFTFSLSVAAAIFFPNITVPWMVFAALINGAVAVFIVGFSVTFNRSVMQLNLDEVPLRLVISMIENIEFFVLGSGAGTDKVYAEFGAIKRTTGVVGLLSGIFTKFHERSTAISGEFLDQGATRLFRLQLLGVSVLSVAMASYYFDLTWGPSIALLLAMMAIALNSGKILDVLNSRSATLRTTVILFMVFFLLFVLSQTILKQAEHFVIYAYAAAAIVRAITMTWVLRGT